MPRQADTEDITRAPNQAEKDGIEDAGCKTGGKHKGLRKRVSQACERCRQRKDRCDGTKPACSTCLTNGRSCSYDVNVRKRGLPEGYVRGMEKLWGLAIRDVEAVEDNILLAISGGADNKETSVALWNDESTSENLVDIWRKSQISCALERLLSSQEPAITDSKRKRSDSENQAGKRRESYPSLPSVSKIQNSRLWPDRLLDQRPPEENQRQSLSDINHVAVQEVESQPSSSNIHISVSSSMPGSDASMPELPAETWHLLDIYFSYTHSWLPIIEKHDLLRTSYQYSSQPSTQCFASGDHAVLWATMTFAKLQCRATNSPGQFEAAGEMWTAERMYMHARSLIPNEEVGLEVGHVQALLILTLANMGMGHYSRAWSLVGFAVRAAIDLQLDRFSVRECSAFKSKPRSKHIFLGCFVLDTLVAARLDRRPHIRAEDLDLIGTVDEDGLEEWDPWADCLAVRKNKAFSRVPATILSTFNQLISVLRILNEMICMPRCANNLQLSNALLEKLQDWSRSQSPLLYHDKNPLECEQTFSLLPHRYHLYGVYLATLTTSQLLSYRHGIGSRFLEPCTRSARHTTDLLNRHSTSFGVMTMSPTFEFLVKTAYDVVHAVRSSIEITATKMDDWKGNLDIFLDSMETAWPVFERLKSQTLQPSARGRRESQVAFNHISGSGVSQDSDTPKSDHITPIYTCYEMAGEHSLSTLRPHKTPSLHPRSSASVRQAPARQTSVSQFSPHGLPQNPLSIYQNAHVKFGDRNRGALEKDALQQAPTIKFYLPDPAPTQSSDHLPFSRATASSPAEIDYDPLFDSLIHLDATEWTGNWDQSLLNLGFTSTDGEPNNMNRDFYSFCQEPDPLARDGVWQQQLVAIGNAKASALFDPASMSLPASTMALAELRDGSRDLTSVIGLGIDFGVGVGFGVESEGIEASQILQSLSASERVGEAGRVMRDVSCVTDEED